MLAKTCDYNYFHFATKISYLDTYLQSFLILNTGTTKFRNAAKLLSELKMVYTRTLLTKKF